MNDAIYLINDASGEMARRLEPTPYATEHEFQGLLERFPELLAGEQIDRESPRRWLLVGREIGIPDSEGLSARWALDHLFVDQDGTPTLVEVKRQSDTRIRREVVGQVLEYAANALAFSTFLFTQHLQETRLFTELFKEFNARYNSLNSRMNRIVETADTGIHGDDRQTLIDYFNLCAEEYMYFRAGYIDSAVWIAWRTGMKFYGDVPKIRRIWESELARGSYYGFSLAELTA
jgi:hypothetical protein